MNRLLLALLLASLLVAPATAFGSHCDGASGPLHLNLCYPAFGGFDLNEDQELGQIFGWFYGLLVGVSGLAAFIMIVWGGIQWLSSAGDPGRISESRERIQQALVGLLLVLVSFLLLQVINPELTVLTAPEL